jgi:UDP-N-acetylglucosamine--N-acetylmuramyl-(pentapeptide) pyrophosphoryl-undecaprenol N-acetylglucosamine transferase
MPGSGSPPKPRRSSLICRRGSRRVRPPSILVPLPHALDQDQYANAGVLERAGGALRLTQDKFTPHRLADEIAGLAAAAGRLQTMAAAAKSVGRLDAAERLADLVLQVAETGVRR